MQVTIDIPEPVYRRLAERAAKTQRPMEEVVLGQVLRVETAEEFRLRFKDRYPLIKSDAPGSMILPEGGFNDALFQEIDEPGDR